MAKLTSPALPETLAQLTALGERLRLARMRRQLQSKQVAERAGMSVITLRKTERGDPGVTMGAYLNVLHVLQLQDDLRFVAQEDALGRKLQDASLDAGKSGKWAGHRRNITNGGAAGRNASNVPREFDMAREVASEYGFKSAVEQAREALEHTKLFRPDTAYAEVQRVLAAQDADRNAVIQAAKGAVDFAQSAAQSIKDDDLANLLKRVGSGSSGD